MYNSASDMLKITEVNKCHIYDVVINFECRLTGESEVKIKTKMEGMLNVMIESSHLSLKKELESVSGFTGGDAKKVYNYMLKGKTICGDVINNAVAMALSSSEVNAAMGRIVAAPTAGSCGIVPSAIITASKILNADKSKMLNALFTASGVGQLIAKNATLSGAEGGCQAECGSASAMASAAVVEMYGGSPKAAFNAAAMALKNVLGLTCDPVAGLVEIPCIKRNASGVVNALMCADMALADVESKIPFDEVVETMYKIGRAMPEQLRETALGGLAVTPTGLKLGEKIK